MVESDSSEKTQSDDEQGSSNSQEVEGSESDSESTTETGEESHTEPEVDKGKRSIEGAEDWQDYSQERNDEVGEDGDADHGDRSIALTDGYSSTGPGRIDLPMPYDVNVPRILNWVASSVTETKSLYEAGEDMSVIVNKLSIRGRLWNVEGMKSDEHAATWPGSLKFVMYDVLVSDMHIRPPFTNLQQTVLARLDLAPSQLHPNGWAFLRAFELMCLALDRPVSADLFFHLFEVNRNYEKGVEGSAPEHVSLRSRRGAKIFRAYSDSLKGRWKELFYFVEPVNGEAIDHVGKFGEDGRTLESTKFPIGWGLGHYNRSPGSYHIGESHLCDADLLTRDILLFISAQIPYTKHKYRGIPTDRMVKCATKRKVMRVLGRVLHSTSDLEGWSEVVSG